MAEELLTKSDRDALLWAERQETESSSAVLDEIARLKKLERDDNVSVYQVSGPLGLNVRSAPSIRAPITRALVAYECILVYGKPVYDKEGNTWVRHEHGFSMVSDAVGRHGGIGNPQVVGAQYATKIATQGRVVTKEQLARLNDHLQEDYAGLRTCQEAATKEARG